MINKFEIRRKLLHILLGIILILTSLFSPYAKKAIFVLLVLGVFISFLSTQYKLPVITKCLCIFERECNKHFPGKGVLFFLIGSLLSLQLFPKEIALASIMILTFADPLSCIIGSSFGKIKLINEKNIEGTIAGIFIGTLLASLFVPVYLAFIGSLFAMIFELTFSDVVDDNLLIPLIAGTIMYLLYLI